MCQSINQPTFLFQAFPFHNQYHTQNSTLFTQYHYFKINTHPIPYIFYIHPVIRIHMESDPKAPSDVFILLTDNRQESRVIRIKDNKQFRWRKMPIPIKTIAQHPFYTLFEVGNNKLTPIEWTFEQPDCPFEAEQPQQANNNRQIFVVEDAQKLQQQQIFKMKQELRPEELIEQLIGNNQQFSKRTEYSKEKYIKKKQRKYLFRIHAEPVSLANIHQHYFKTDLRSIYSIRWDMFALMLLHGGPYKRVLVGDQGRGLLIGAVIERGATQVTVAVSKPLTLKQFHIVEQLNIAKQKQDSVKFIQWGQFKQQPKTFDNLLLMGNYDFVGILQLVDPYLQRGAPVALVCQSLAPLEAAARELKTRGYLNVRLFDSWAREYQVLKNRTHPMMNMDSCSGFLLSALKMEPF